MEIYLRQPCANEFSAKHAFIEENKETCEVLLMGSSHIQTGLNPEWIDKRSINVANFSEPFYYDYKILEKYIGQMPALNTVVLSLSYPIFFSGPSHRQENLYYIYWGLEPYSGKLSVDDFSVVMAQGLDNAIEKIFDNENYYQHFGWYKATEIYDGGKEEAERKVATWHGMMKEEEWDESTAWLNGVISICEKNNVRLILYYPPFADSLNSLIKDDQWQHRIAKYVDDLGKHKSITIIDANTNNSYLNRHFRDPDHLNFAGAKILTKTINNVLNDTLFQN